MNRLEELLLKWHDRTLGDEELRELNAALKEPAGRKQLLESFAFDAEVVEALHSVKAIEHTAQSAEEFQTLELRDSEVFPAPASAPWTKRVLACITSVRYWRDCLQN